MFYADGCYDVGAERETRWIVESVSRANRLFDPGDEETSRVSLRSAARVLRDKKVTSIWLDTDATEPTGKMQSLLRGIPGLRQLMLPSQFAPLLRPEMISPDVKELWFYGQYDRQYWKNSTVTLTSKSPFVGIESLTGPLLCYRCPTRLKLEAEAFPNLRAIDFSFDPRRRFGATLRRLTKLVAVSVANFDSIEQLGDLLDPPSILSLTLGWNAKLETLAGIDEFRNLRHLKATSLTHLRTLDDVASLDKLEFIGIYWSKRVDDPFGLLRVPNLKAISTFGNEHRKPIWRALRERAAARGIDVARMV